MKRFTFVKRFLYISAKVVIGLNWYTIIESYLTICYNDIVYNFTYNWLITLKKYKEKYDDNRRIKK